MSAVTPGQTTAFAPGSTPSPAPAAPADAAIAPPKPAAQAEQYHSLAGCLTLLLVVVGVFMAMGLFIALFGDVQ